MKKIFSILSLLLCSAVTFAQVQIAEGIANGTVKSAISDKTVTLTVTPADGYYLADINAAKIVDPANLGRTRGDGSIPVVGDYTLTKTSTSADRSQTATYTLTLGDGLGAYVTASFAARTAITATQVSLSATEFTYDGSSHQPTVSLTGLTSGTDYTVSYAGTAWTDAGTYTVTVTGIDTYKGSVDKTWTINKATLSGVSATDYEGTYDGQAHTATVTAPEGATVKYGTAEGTYTLDAAPTFTNAGTATIYYQVSKANYTTVTGSAKVTIGKTALTIKANDQTKVFGEEDPALTYAVEGLVEGESLTGALTRAEGDNVGEYAITQGTLAASDNYTVSFTGATLTITAATISGVSATDYSATYDGQAHTISLSAPEGTTVKYGTAEGTYTLDAAPTFTNAGTATVYYQVSKANYTAVAGSAKVTISKKTLTITADDQTKVFGEKDPELTYTVEGLVSGEKLTGKLARAEGEDVGEYDITQGTLAASDNYTVTFTGATLTITAAAISGDANGDTEVNVADIDYVIERIGSDYETNKAADVNGDGMINVADVDFIIERIN